MPQTRNSLKESVARQRQDLVRMLQRPLQSLAEACRTRWGERAALNALLLERFAQIPNCTYLYALGPDFVQINDNIRRDGPFGNDYGRDRSQRPYVREVSPERDFLLSEAYISLRARRPSLTAIQTVRDAGGDLLGYIGADFDLRDLPMTRELYEEPYTWQQIRGDPSIRGGVFQQTRSESQVDRHIEVVLGVLEELMVDHGVFHVMLHFSSSRAVIWLLDDPYRYRLLDIDALVDPDVCLAYPRRDYPTEAVVAAGQVRPILDAFRTLRLSDETLYLRTGTLNIFNGLVGLTFSCDGSHYIPHEEFLDTGHAFWASAAPPGTGGP